MIIFHHRRNTKAELVLTPCALGVEVDIRSHNKNIVIHHDPFSDGEIFEEWLEAYKHQGLILNVKEEGLENRLQLIMKERNISNYFFLDQSFPFLIKTALDGERRCAVRVSEYESIETALLLKNMIDWVWVDCFTRFPLNRLSISLLKEAGFKICIVSPELQKRNTMNIVQIRDLLESESIKVDAVCTKEPLLWL